MQGKPPVCKETPAVTVHDLVLPVSGVPATHSICGGEGVFPLPVATVANHSSSVRGTS
jgi:hypothetical protein